MDSEKARFINGIKWIACWSGCNNGWSNCVSPLESVYIGFIGGCLVVLSVFFFDEIVKVDDPVGATSVHLANGVWGTIAVGIWGKI